ncbi:MAG: YraN family protein [Bacteroidetes bacterium]|nr:YraN family protein [Bacteroidota bacterium]
MADHIEFGKKGEDLAVQFLQKKGYKILKRNYRYKRAEIDIIAQKEGLLIFVEVKARNRIDFGYPEDAVNEKKVELIQEASENFMEESAWGKEYEPGSGGQIRFDIISITLEKGVLDILHIEDAF